MHVPTNAPFLKPMLRFYWGWRGGNECSVLVGVGSLSPQEVLSLGLYPLSHSWPLVTVLEK